MANEKQITGRNKEPARIMISAQIPGQVYEILYMYCLKNGKKLTEGIKEALAWWREQNGLTKDRLISELSKDYQSQWYHLKSLQDGMAFSDFLKSIRDHLEQKKLSEDTVSKIISQIEK